MKKAILLITSILLFSCSDDDSSSAVQDCDCKKYVEINQHIVYESEPIPEQWKLYSQANQGTFYSNDCKDDGKRVFYYEDFQTNYNDPKQPTLVTQIRHKIKCE